MLVNYLMSHFISWLISTLSKLIYIPKNLLFLLIFEIIYLFQNIYFITEGYKWIEIALIPEIFRDLCKFVLVIEILPALYFLFCAMFNIIFSYIFIFVNIYSNMMKNTCFSINSDCFFYKKSYLITILAHVQKIS